MTRLIRPLVQWGTPRPEEAVTLAGGWCWFTHVEIIGEGIRTAHALSEEEVARFSTPRSPLLGRAFDRPLIMAILNVTPDSFSDGGAFASRASAIDRAAALVAQGADILDIGGESTRPGADVVPVEVEISRTKPVIEGIVANAPVPISIDTRKAPVAEAAIEAGARMINDVSALSFDPQMRDIAANSAAAVFLMHAQGDPQTMQVAPRYEDVLTEVYRYLEERIALAVGAGIALSRIVVDPGIGFGKTLEHNLILLKNLSVFHGLGCGVLVGASRKRFIGTIGGAEDPRDRVPGSLAVALEAVAQGVQVIRVHDLAETSQALALSRAVREGYWHG